MVLHIYPHFYSDPFYFLLLIVPKPDLLAIINPLTGTRSLVQKERLRTELLRRAAAAGYTPDAVQTTGPGHATQLAERAQREGVARVLVLGGDGTINETARALRYSATALGIIPIGSGNGLARHLGISLNPLVAIDRALTGRPVVIDSGEINEHPFFCTAGMGFDALVAHAFAKQATRGLATYVQTAYQIFRRYQPQRYQVDGQEKSLFVLTFANAAQFGNNAWIAPTANIADGRLERCEMTPFPNRFVALTAWQLFNRTLDRSSFWHGESVTTTTVQAPAPLLIHADGEPLTLDTGVAQVRVLPGSLLVIL